MSVPDDAVFEVRVTKHMGDGFSVVVDGARVGISEREAIVGAIELLVLHLENASGLRSWDEGVAEGVGLASG